MVVGEEEKHGIIFFRAVGILTDPGPATVRHLSAQEFLLEPVLKQLRVDHCPNHVHTGTRRNFDTAGLRQSCQVTLPSQNELTSHMSMAT